MSIWECYPVWCCGVPAVEIQHQELGVCGVCGDGVLCSGKPGTFRLMFGCLLSSIHPPSFTFFPLAFSFLCLHSFSARDINTSRSNRRSFCLTGRDSRESAFTGWEREEVEESGWDSVGWKNCVVVVGEDTVWYDWGGCREVGDEGRSNGRALEEDMIGRNGLSLPSSYSDGCRTTSV